MNPGKYLILFLALSPHLMRSQERAVYFEALGPSTFAGLWYDARIGGGGFGWSAGMAFVPSQTDDIGLWTKGTWTASLPVSLNYLFGKGGGHLEIGAGMHNGIMKGSEGRVRWGHYFFADIGYRFQKRGGGFLFRAGLSPNFRLGGSHGIKKRKFYPYISIGWALGGKK